MIPWEQIKKTTETFETTSLEKIWGNGYKIYRVSDGTIRIDISPDLQKGKQDGDKSDLHQKQGDQEQGGVHRGGG